MFYVSVQDLLQLNKFKHLTEQQLISKENDKEVLKEAFIVGMDIEAGYTYEPALHRPLSGNKAIVGYRLIGEVRKDREFRLSSFYTPEMQMLSSLRSDISLTKELRSLSGTTFDYGKVVEEDAEKDRESAESIEKDFDKDTALIKLLTAQVLQVRGSHFNEWQTLKSFKEWHK